MTPEQRAERKAERERLRVMYEESAKRTAEQRERVKEIVRTGKCPKCGRGLVRNLSMTGWWQCEQLGSVAFRKHPELPSCGWQGFTE